MDIIHPGYGFLSENAEFRPRLRRSGHHLRRPAPGIARHDGRQSRRPRAGPESSACPRCPAPRSRSTDRAEALEDRADNRLPAHHQGGLRRRRTRHARRAQSRPISAHLLDEAQGEAGRAFGNPAVFLEKYIPRAKHIEVQILGDQHGNVHPPARARLLRAAPPPESHRNRPVRRPRPDAVRERIVRGRRRAWRARSRYDNAGTVEFLYDLDTQRMVLHRDESAHPGRAHRHRSHHRRRSGALADPHRQGLRAARPGNRHAAAGGHPAQRLRRPMPHHHRGPGKQIHARLRQDPHLPLRRRLRRAAGRRHGLRRRGHHAVLRFAAGQDHRLRAAISSWPCSAWTGPCANSASAASRPTFHSSKTSSPTRLSAPARRPPRLIDTTPELFRVQAAPRPRHQAARLPRRRHRQRQSAGQGPCAQRRRCRRSLRRRYDRKQTPPPGTRQLLLELGPEEIRRVDSRAKSGCSSPTPPSATRINRSWPRACAPTTCWPSPTPWRAARRNFSAWKCGAARPSTPPCASCTRTRGTACALLRERIPNICFQMLFRGANAVGYSNYPDNVVAGFVKHAAAAGHRYFPHLRFAQLHPESARWPWRRCRKPTPFARRRSVTPATSSIPTRTKYSLKYYVKLAKELEKMGAHFLAIKDMAGLCRPYAAYALVKALKEEIGIPIHFHTHDTSGVNSASVLKASDAGVDMVGPGHRLDERLHQPAQPQFHRRRPAAHAARHRPGSGRAQRILRLLGTGPRLLRALRHRARAAGSAEVYLHEMPGGQYTNLKEQAASMGLAPALAGNRPHLRRGQPAFRRHRQSHAQQQGRGRHGDVPHHARHQAGRRSESRTRQRPLPRIGHRHA